MKSAILFSVLGVILLAQLTIDDLPRDTSTLFAGSGLCANCHEPGLTNPAALLDAQGNDVSPVTLWRSTVMANAARDPIWQAKVTAEVAAHPALKEVIEDKCTTCHMPAARTEAIFNGATGFALVDGQSDPLAMDGVTCTVCHQIKSDNLGTGDSFSGGFEIDDSRIIYGPYDGSQSFVMEGAVNYAIVEGAQVKQSELCATCHTLFTPTVDNAGAIVGQIAEQTPYLEWLNSTYPGNGVECQTCHIPEIEDEVIISAIPPTLSGRTPFGNHYFVGANTFLLEMLKDHGAELGVTATEAQFDSTIARTLRQLQHRSVDVTVDYQWIDGDTLEVSVQLLNKAGHKFPTGFPSRRAWINLEVTNSAEESVFESGDWDSSGEIIGLDTPYEPHHDIIRSPRQAIIYQSMMGDVDGSVTWTLLRGATYLKDNRIPPQGFRMDGAHYDSTAIEGLANQDPNFNRDGEIEGSGTDRVTFRVGGLSPTEGYHVDARLMYQAVSPSFISDLFQYDSPEIDALRGYYENSDIEPVLMTAESFTTVGTGIDEMDPSLPKSPRIVSAYPNPVQTIATLTYDLPVAADVHVSVLDLLGREVSVVQAVRLGPGTHDAVFDATGVSAGLYFWRLEVGDSVVTRKVVVAK